MSVHTPLLLNPLPAPINGGFRDDNWWTWCGSVMRDEQGLYHMFASRWSKRTAFNCNWLTNSTIVRATSKTPEGPYTYIEDIIPQRGIEFWDGRMAHNPTIHRHKDTYLLFYVGSTYDGEVPQSGRLEWNDPRRFQARTNQRIGVATAPSLDGPWTRFDRPVLHPRPEKWDAFMTTNPAPVVQEDGSVMLYYKSTSHDQSRLAYGLARADRFDGPYESLVEDPLFGTSDDAPSYEDAYVWKHEARFHMIFNDLRGAFTGEDHAGGYAQSEDGIDWQPCGKAYSRQVQWEDGTTTTQGSLERPQLLIIDGKPTHLFAATADGPGGFAQASNTWNMVLPLGNFHLP